MFLNSNHNRTQDPGGSQTQKIRLFNYQITTKTTDRNSKKTKTEESDFELIVIIGSQRAGVIITVIQNFNFSRDNVKNSTVRFFKKKTLIRVNTLGNNVKRKN